MLFDDTNTNLDTLAAIDKDSSFIFVYEANDKAMRPSYVDQISEA